MVTTEPDVQHATVEVRKTEEGQMLEVDNMLSIYFVPPADSAAAAGVFKLVLQIWKCFLFELKVCQLVTGEVVATSATTIESAQVALNTRITYCIQIVGSVKHGNASFH